MNNFIKTFAARLIGGLVASATAWLAVRYGLEVNADDQAKLVTDIVATLMTIYSVVYPLVHRTVSKKTNPGDAASSHLAGVEARETARLKQLS